MNKLQVSLVCLALAATSAQGATIKIATVAPDGTAWMREMRAAGDAIKQKSEGRVEIKYYPGGVMGDSATVLRKIKIGQLQGGAFTGSEASMIAKDAQIYSLPFVFRNEAELQGMRASLDSMLHRQFAAQGYKLLGISGGGFAYLFSTRDIKGADDLAAAKVWVPQGDAIAEMAFKASGVTPIALPLADVYTGLQTGLVDTAANTPAGAIAFQWHTRMKYMVDLPLTYVVGELVVTNKAFEALSEADRALVEGEFAAGFARLEAINRGDNESARKALEQQGIAITVPGEASRARYDAIGQDVLGQLVAKGEVSAPVLDAFKQALAGIRAGSTP